VRPSRSPSAWTVSLADSYAIVPNVATLFSFCARRNRAVPSIFGYGAKLQAVSESVVRAAGGNSREDHPIVSVFFVAGDAAGSSFKL